MLQRRQPEIGEQPIHHDRGDRAQLNPWDFQESQQHGPPAAGHRVVEAATVGVDERPRVGIERGRLRLGIDTEIEEPDRTIDGPSHRLVAQKFEQSPFGRQQRQMHLDRPIDRVQATEGVAAADAVWGLDVRITQRGPAVGHRSR